MVLSNLQLRKSPSNLTIYFCVL